MPCNLILSEGLPPEFENLGTCWIKSDHLRDRRRAPQIDVQTHSETRGSNPESSNTIRYTGHGVADGEIIIITSSFNRILSTEWLDSRKPFT